MMAIAILGGIFGALATWATCKHFYDERRREYLRDTTEQMKRSMDIQERFYAMTAMCYLTALEELETGDVESGKESLAKGAARFYHQFSASDDFSPVIIRQKRDIELYAKKSPALQVALSRNEKTD